MVGLAAAGLLAACAFPRPQTSSARTTPFLAPTSAAQRASDPSTTSAAPPETAGSLPTTAACVNALTFLEDLSIPDGSVVASQSTLVKRWQVRNSGTCNWDAAYHLKLIAGTEMGAASELALYPARSGSDAVIEIQFIAPSEAGNYRSAWQAVDPSGAAFGDPIFIDINVQP